MHFFFVLLIQTASIAFSDNPASITREWFSWTSSFCDSSIKKYHAKKQNLNNKGYHESKNLRAQRVRNSESNVEKLIALPDFCFCVSNRQKTKVHEDKISTIKKWHPFL